MAEKYLRQAAEIDLGNNMGNAAGGVHAAAIGGLWQAMVFGFAGMEIRPDGLSLNPHLLPHWRRLSFPLHLRGRKLRVTLEPTGARVQIEGGDEGLKIGVAGGQEIVAHPHHQYVAARTTGLGSVAGAARVSAVPPARRQFTWQQCMIGRRR